MKILITGATGLAGAEAVREAIKDDKITSIVALVRRPLTLQHPKLQVVLHQDYLDYTGLESLFASCDACLWCLGISQTQVTKAEYEVITYDYTIAAAKAMQAANPTMTFVFLSGAGADSTEQSKTIFARVKGKAENSLIKMNWKKLYIVRPAGIRPINKNPNAAFANKIAAPLLPIIELIAPQHVISSVQLAKAMLRIAVTGNSQQIIENVTLKALGK